MRTYILAYVDTWNKRPELQEFTKVEEVIDRWGAYLPDIEQAEEDELEVVDLLDILCEQDGTRFFNYTWVDCDCK